MGNNIADFSTRRLGENRIPFSYYADAGWAVRSADTQLLQPELDLVSYSDIHISSRSCFIISRSPMAVWVSPGVRVRVLFTGKILKEMLKNKILQTIEIMWLTISPSSGHHSELKVQSTPVCLLFCLHSGPRRKFSSGAWPWPRLYSVTTLRAEMMPETHGQWSECDQEGEGARKCKLLLQVVGSDGVMDMSWLHDQSHLIHSLFHNVLCLFGS